jgi:hypothetical protein
MKSIQNASVNEKHHFDATPDQAPATGRQNDAGLAPSFFPWLTHYISKFKNLYIVMWLRF